MKNALIRILDCYKFLLLTMALLVHKDSFKNDNVPNNFLTHFSLRKKFVQCVIPNRKHTTFFHAAFQDIRRRRALNEGQIIMI